MWEPEHSVIVVNPTSGSGWLQSNWERATRRLQKELPGARIMRTRRQGDGSRLAIAAIEQGARTLVSFGGDGTHSEVVDGIMRTGVRKTRLGILHAGTGGDFRTLIQGNERLITACRSIRDLPAEAIDVGKVRCVNEDNGEQEERYFLNLASLGVSGLVDRFATGTKDWIGGPASYFVASLRANAIYKPARVRIVLDQQEYGEFEINILCVCNGRRAGGGMIFAPQARLADGLLDIVILESLPMHKLFPLGIKVYTGAHVHHPRVHIARAKHIQVEVLERRAWVDVDGEAPGIAPATFEVIPSALQLIAPKTDVL